MNFRHGFRHSIHRRRDKSLGVVELIAIALGGMIGGGIFTVLGISAALIGVYTPIAIALGGGLAALAAYSYVKLGVHFREEGATYSFTKRVYSRFPLVSSVIGWWVIFGYISTLALYAYTFSSYALSGFTESLWAQKLVASAVITLFALINLWSVKGMGKLEDLLVYSKLLTLAVIAFTLINNSNNDLPVLLRSQDGMGTQLVAIITIAALTFVAYEGFQLVINATNEMRKPERNIPLAIYAAIILATGIYVVIAIGAIMAIPMDQLVEQKEHALAAAANGSLGHWGTGLVIAGALLATSSAISGTLFGAPRQMAVIAMDGYMPRILGYRNEGIPIYAILAMSGFAILLVLIGNLEIILEFSSITFLLVCLLMAVANFKIRKRTRSNGAVCVAAILLLSLGLVLVVYFQAVHHIEQLYFTMVLYLILAMVAYLFTRQSSRP